MCVGYAAEVEIPYYSDIRVREGVDRGGGKVSTVVRREKICSGIGLFLGLEIVTWL